MTVDDTRQEDFCGRKIQSVDSLQNRLNHVLDADAAQASEINRTPINTRFPPRTKTSGLTPKIPFLLATPHFVVSGRSIPTCDALVLSVVA
jgi:hypothetical protein